MRRVGIYGWGIVAPKAANVDEFADRLGCAESWLAPFEGFGPNNFLVGRPRFSFEAYRPWIEERFPPNRYPQLRDKMDLAALYAGAASFVQAEDVRLRGNAAGVGGGLFLEGAMLELIHVQILGNLARGESYDGIAAQGGGLYAVDAVIEIHDSRFAENLAWGPNTLGGGLRVLGEGKVP